MNGLLACAIICAVCVAAWLAVSVDPDEYDPADQEKTMGDE